MSVDYRQQYRPDQLEPFWPNELMKMSVSVLCTLAVIMFFVVLPVGLDAAGLHGVVHTEEPADPHGSTPAGIKPEWYFLASYQYLRVMPTEVLGVGGKTLGVVTQGLAVSVLALLPFWYRRRAAQRPRWAYRLGVTAIIALVLGLTIWGGWPEEHVGGEERLLPLSAYVRGKPLLFAVLAIGLIVFYALVAAERATIRRTLDGPGPEAVEADEAAGGGEEGAS